MAIKSHPMSALKGTPEGKALMAQVSAHKTGAKKSPVESEDAADRASEPGGEPVSEKGAAVNFMNKRRAAAAKR